MKKPVRYVLALSLLGLLPCTSALASSSSSDCTDPSSTTCGNYLWNFANLSPVGNAVTASASHSSTTLTSSATGWHAGSATSQMVQDTPLPGVTVYGSSGLGVTTSGDSSTNGTHGIDNRRGYDLVIFAFNQAVTLTEITFGYVRGDADFQLFAYNDAYAGAGPADTNPFDNQIAYNSTDNSGSLKGLTNVGWDLLGSYGSASTSTPSVTSVAAQTVVSGVGRGSKFWAVGAYSSTVLGGTTVGSPDHGDDAFKLQKLCGNLYVTTPPPGVPEPATLSLLALGALGAMRLRRRAS
jgi:hypothetical protein